MVKKIVAEDVNFIAEKKSIKIQISGMEKSEFVEGCMLQTIMIFPELDNID